MTIKKPEPDGFLTILIAGRYVEINAYRDSTMENYAEAYAQARVDEALEKAAVACEERIGKGSAGVSLEDFDIEAQECALTIRALKGKV